LDKIRTYKEKADRKLIQRLREITCRNTQLCWAIYMSRGGSDSPTSGCPITTCFQCCCLFYFLYVSSDLQESKCSQMPIQ
jgi:hypothetical protein